MASLRSPVPVKQPTLRVILVLALLASSAFAAWSWLRPYSWNPDPMARCKAEGVQIRKDQAYHWVDIHLKVNPGQTHDLAKPVRLRTHSGRDLEPADTTLGSDQGGGTTDLWFKFWLEPGDIEGPLTLLINDGTLLIKSGNGVPDLGETHVKYFVTQHW